jgi:hypothetical protein
MHDSAEQEVEKIKKKEWLPNLTLPNHSQVVNLDLPKSCILKSCMLHVACCICCMLHSCMHFYTAGWLLHGKGDVQTGSMSVWAHILFPVPLSFFFPSFFLSLPGSFDKVTARELQSAFFCPSQLQSTPQSSPSLFLSLSLSLYLS